MDKKRYLEIRGRFSFERKRTALVRYFLVDFALIALITWTAAKISALLTIPLLAILMFRNFGILHDAAHGAVHSNRTLNDFVGVWSGIFCLLPFEPWRKSHLQHHFWTGNIQKDPVSALRIELPKASSRFIAFMDFTWKKWIPMLGAVQNLLFWRLSIKLWKNERSLKNSLSIAIPLLVWLSAFVLFPVSFTLGALLPGLALYYLMNELVNMPHHLQLPLLSGDERHAVWDQHEVARSCVYPKWFARNVVLNFNYHAEHHMFPEAPWYYLEELHDVIKAELGSRMHADVSLGWTLANRSLPFIEVITKDHPPSKKVA